jgi:hypothetical protein
MYAQPARKNKVKTERSIWIHTDTLPKCAGKIATHKGSFMLNQAVDNIIEKDLDLDEPFDSGPPTYT